MNVCLVYPEPYPLYTNREKKSVPEGLGLLYLATMIRPHHDVTIIGSAFNPLSNEEILAQLEERQPDVIGISTIFSSLMRSGRHIARQIKRRLPHAVVVFGGNHCHFIAHQLIREEYTDVVALGEGELTFLELVEHIERRQPLDDLAGILFKRDGVPVMTAPRQAISNLDSLPFPDRRLLFRKVPVNFNLPLCGSRGCPYHCIYCSTTAFWGRKWRPRSADNILAEIEWILSTMEWEEGAKPSFGFVDDNMTVNRARIERFCHLIQQRGHTFTWGGSSRLELMDEPLIDLLAASNCSQVFFGIESGSDRVLAKLNRRYTRQQVIDTVGKCIRGGILPILSFIVGFPFETKWDVEQTLSLIQEVPSYKVQVHVLTPFIGTDAFEKSEQLGLKLLSRDVESMNLESAPVISTEHLTPAEIQQYFHRGMGYCMKRGREGPRIDETCRRARAAIEQRRTGAMVEATQYENRTYQPAAS